MRTRYTTPRPSRACAGFTLIELSLAVFFLASMMLAAGFAVDRATSMLRQRRAEEEVAMLACRLVQRVAGELDFARRETLEPVPEPPLGADALRFQRSTGVLDGAVQWSVPCTLGFEYEPGELDDDLDNDGDGLVDEGLLAWTENPGQPDELRVILGHGLREFLAGEDFNGADDNANGLTDERGLSFSIQGDVLTIRVAVQGLGPTRKLITKTAETSVFLRN